MTTAAGGELTVSEAGNVVTVGGTATVIDADLVAGNGLIHAINAVLVPPSLTKAPAPTQSIVEIAAGNPDFSTLVSLVQKAGLVTAISSPGPFTVFAPTNAAFEKLAAAAPATYAAVLPIPPC